MLKKDISIAIKKLKKMLLEMLLKKSRIYKYVEGRKLKSKCPVCKQNLEFATDHDEPNNFYNWFIRCPNDNKHFDPEGDLNIIKRKRNCPIKV